MMSPIIHKGPAHTHARETMQLTLKAKKHLLAEAYADQSAKKREIKETEKSLALQVPQKGPNNRKRA